MCAFLFLGAVTGVLEMSDMGVLEITNGNPPPPLVGLGLGGPHAQVWVDNPGMNNIVQCQVNIQTSSVILCISLSDFWRSKLLGLMRNKLNSLWS